VDRPQTAARPEVAELEDPRRFACVLRVAHRDLAAFLEARASAPRGAFMRLHLGLAGLFGIAVGAAFLGAPGGGWNLARALLGGTLAAVLLFPLHEALHAAAYLALGARDLRLRFTLRPLAAYLVAHRFVLTRRALRQVALAPTVVLAPGLVLVALLAPALRAGALVALFVHHLGAGGDFAMAGLFEGRGGAGTYTVDDAEAGETSVYACLEENR